MEKQTAPDALDRALTDLYRIDLPDGYRAAWRAAVKREELKTMNPPRRTSPFLRVAPNAQSLARASFTLRIFSKNSMSLGFEPGKPPSM